MIVTMPHEAGRPKRRSWTGLPTSIDLIEMLPKWAQILVMVLGIVFFFYSVAHYGLGTTLLKTLLSP
jgi:hypothetical protein